MNKYKKGFTPDEAALIAVGFPNYSNLDALESNISVSLADSKSIEKYLPSEEEVYAPRDQKAAYIESRVKELINEAKNIRDALRSELLLAYAFEEEEINKKTSLEIYLVQFKDSDENEICTLRSQLTKASLAKWFDAADQVYMSKKFKDEKLSTINPFKKSFTAEHSALIAVGLNKYSSIDEVFDKLNYQNEQIADARWQIEKGGEYTDFEIDESLSYDLINDAENIKQALMDEIKIAIEVESVINESNSSCRNAAGIELCCDATTIDVKAISLESITITKQSLAIWLWESGQVEYAKNIFANVETLIQNKPPHKNLSNSKISSKEINASKSLLESVGIPESSLLDAMGIMALLLSKQNTKFKHGETPNASQIKTAIESMVEDLGLNKDTDNRIMLSNLNKAITISWNQLKGRIKL
ncbi:MULTISPECIES: hypothetical protein [Pseudoalteromonas]|uniref:hypothetical protein n=1 Tax=Pseudoalteromonas TaxID=53246 RepID=UPI0002C9A4EB|nr:MULTISPECIES: hypothetical protein [Pseudoalteromonas]ENN98258.1 hypothetical protein J139_13680 [Pseudoalteromonas agarivorans S816]TMS67129.1 hypothetical protein CWB83_07790 [Pseudoalteromonas sp. S1691]TMS71634.1 hypothetical protein CWB86_05110 [Pseudoalteromonas sp. S1731]TMS73742.1 hypothetical protein CWB88_10265 [Pseudoalteromonas sp. S1941]TMS79393.1 hypothetical protein CWB82_00225 [Pseudoalteromonas sp. S1690]